MHFAVANPCSQQTHCHDALPLPVISARRVPLRTGARIQIKIGFAAAIPAPPMSPSVACVTAHRRAKMLEMTPDGQPNRRRQQRFRNTRATTAVVLVVVCVSRSHR